MHKNHIWLIAAGIVLISGANAFSFTAQRHATVEIVEAPGGIRQIDERSGGQLGDRYNDSHDSGNNETGNGFNGVVSKEITVTGNQSQIKETQIDIEYTITKAANNVQLSVVEDPSGGSLMKFKSMQATYAEANQSGRLDAGVKLATVVTIPKNINSGKYYLSLQLSAHYE